MVTVSNSEGRTAWEKVAMSIIASHNIPDEDVETLKLAHKSKPTKTISVKEAADADAIYAEIVSATKTETSVVSASTEAINQPHPVW